MSVIWDFSLQVKPEGEMIMAPEGATFMSHHIVVKGDIPHIYAVVDPGQKMIPYFFHVICAGQKFIVEEYDDHHWSEIHWATALHPVGVFTIGDSFIGNIFVQRIPEYGDGPIRVTVDERYEDDFEQVGER